MGCLPVPGSGLVAPPTGIHTHNTTQLVCPVFCIAESKLTCILSIYLCYIFRRDKVLTEMPI